MDKKDRLITFAQLSPNNGDDSVVDDGEITDVKLRRMESMHIEERLQKMRSTMILRQRDYDNDEG